MFLLLASSPPLIRAIPNQDVQVVRRLAVLLFVVFSGLQGGGAVQASPACIHCLNSHSSRGAPYRIQIQQPQPKHTHPSPLPSCSTSVVPEGGSDGAGVTSVPMVSSLHLPPWQLQLPGISAAFQRLQEHDHWRSDAVAMATMGTNRSIQQLLFVLSIQPGATTVLQQPKQRHRPLRQFGNLLRAVTNNDSSQGKEMDDGGVETVCNETAKDETAEERTTTLEEKTEQQPQQQDESEPTPLVSAAMVATIGIYKNFISPLLPPACRFVPTCSQYGVQAIEKLGPVKGVILIAWRLLRCSPVGGSGYDPPQWPPVSYTYKGNWMD
jgi:uncharacterized protein